MGGSGDDVAGATVLNASAVVQFARDAFPGPEVARESPFDKLPKLFWTLVILLVVTCFVSWDLLLASACSPIPLALLKSSGAAAI